MALKGKEKKKRKGGRGGLDIEVPSKVIGNRIWAKMI